jgi:CRISPR-associated endonuclease/helicase Cas3
MPEIAGFADFYLAVNGRSPLPWQTRLAERVITCGWPDEIGVPTGLGKTSCLDIAIWALAASTVLGYERLPTRVWYVVNRRLLVDAAWKHGTDLARLLANPSQADRGRAAIASVARALSSLAGLGLESGPLFVTRLRGGAELGARPPDPSQPSILLATVPMFASRWLFRGYASSAYMRPVDAAHAGIDSVVLLDEAHLARPLVQLADNAADCDTGEPSAVLNGPRARPIVVAMTATGEAREDRFDLNDADRANPVVARRLHAVKSGKLVETTSRRLAEELCAQAAAAIRGRHEACVVFANTPRLAREVAEHLRARERDFDVVLVTGRVRDREADRLRERLLDPQKGVMAGQVRKLERPLVVVATQTLEVGADFDFDHLVSETAGVRSLIQRLGRVNRLGDRERATCTVCHPADSKAYPVYGAEVGKVWGRLKDALDGATQLDLSPANISSVLGAPEDCPKRVGELLPAHLWEWAKTTTPPPGEAPVDLFFEGFDTDLDVSVVWRAHRPADGVRLFPAVSGQEAVDIPVSEIRAALANRSLRRLADDKMSLETIEVAALHPGDVVVLAPEDGFYDEDGWNPNSRDPVLDISPLISGTLVLDKAVLANLASACLDNIGPLLEALVEPAEDGEQDNAKNLAGLVEALRACRPHRWVREEEWQAFLDGLGSEVTRPVGPADSVDVVPSVGPVERKHRRAGLSLRSAAFEELSFTASSPALRQHLDAVGETAALLASRLGLPAELVRALRLAGEWHDLGKHDPRFQRWMSPDEPPPEPIAKSGQPRERWESSRVSSGWPKGGRHELLSVRLATSWMQSHTLDDLDTELVLHLVASHHGGGRPLVTVVEDPLPTTVIAEVAGEPVCMSGDLSQPDWDQPRRFRRVCERYGLWGVALLEALLKQADGAVSSLTEVA